MSSLGRLLAQSQSCVLGLDEGYYLAIVEKDKSLANLEREEQCAVARLLLEQTRGLRALLGDVRREHMAWLEFNNDLKTNLHKACGFGEMKTQEY